MVKVGEVREAAQAWRAMPRFRPLGRGRIGARKDSADARRPHRQVRPPALAAGSDQVTIATPRFDEMRLHYSAKLVEAPLATFIPRMNTWAASALYT
jgi:hypothetical protein